MDSSSTSPPVRPPLWLTVGPNAMIVTSVVSLVAGVVAVVVGVGLLADSTAVVDDVANRSGPYAASTIAAGTVGTVKLQAGRTYELWEVTCGDASGCANSVGRPQTADPDGRWVPLEGGLREELTALHSRGGERVRYRGYITSHQLGRYTLTVPGQAPGRIVVTPVLDQHTKQDRGIWAVVVSIVCGLLALVPLVTWLTARTRYPRALARPPYPYRPPEPARCSTTGPRRLLLSGVALLVAAPILLVLGLTTDQTAAGAHGRVDAQRVIDVAGEPGPAVIAVVEPGQSVTVELQPHVAYDLWVLGDERYPALHQAPQVTGDKGPVVVSEGNASRWVNVGDHYGTYMWDLTYGPVGTHVVSAPDDARVALV
ncbi:MAG: hypothetical protein FWD11_09620, partial [Micrococcales bacterium]|nr:hypothetical protein [Micrococcales bacterium]